jgi:hypothetical protein
MESSIVGYKQLHIKEGSNLEFFYDKYFENTCHIRVGPAIYLPIDCWSCCCRYGSFYSSFLSADPFFYLRGLKKCGTTY